MPRLVGCVGRWRDGWLREWNRQGCRPSTRSCTSVRLRPGCATACNASRWARTKARRSDSKPRAPGWRTAAPTSGRRKTGVVGAMLRQRIGAERERGDADPGRHAGGGGSLVDQLARARLPPLAPFPCRTPAGMCARILLICTPSVTNAMLRILPPHRGHTSGNTFLSRPC